MSSQNKPNSGSQIPPQLSAELVDAKDQLISIFEHFGDIYFWDLGRKARAIALTAMVTNFLVFINANFMIWVDPVSLRSKTDLAQWAANYTGVCTVYYLVLAVIANFSLSFPRLQKAMLTHVLISLVFTLSIFSGVIGFFDSLTWFIFFLYTALGFVLLDWRQVMLTDTGIIVMMILVSLYPESFPFPAQAYLFSDVNTLTDMSFLELLSAWTLTAGAAFSGMWIMSFLLRNWHVQGIEHVSSSHLDPLTQVLKRRFVLDALADETILAAREKSVLTVAVIDLDKFKKLNEEHGHIFGDKILTHFAKHLTQATHRQDLVGRYGGQEFIVVFPRCDSDAAIKVLESLRLTLSNTPIQHELEGSVFVRFSAGICQLRSGDQKFENVIARADRALSQAKALGGDAILLDGSNEAEVFA